MSDERLDEGRRAVLKAAGLAGVALLVPARARAADEAEAGLLGGAPADGGAEAQTTAPKFQTIQGLSDRVVKSTQSVPSLDAAALRIALDVHRDSRSGEIIVRYGTGTATAGAGLTAISVKPGAAPKIPQPDANGVATLTLTFQVVSDPKTGVSIIAPGGDPSGG